MKNNPQENTILFGTTKVLENGEIVIPVEARELFNIKNNDSLLVIGDKEKQSIAIVKAELLEDFAVSILEEIGFFNKEQVENTN